ncbi:MAG: PAS domain-containing hybrid sensor histidine kinase/response regulator [Pseudomonadota bacterium]
MQGWGIILVAIAYILCLFIVASFGDRRRRKTSQNGRPFIYSLSLAIYCTSWTFFGSVGLATTSGLDFLAIYLGPALMMTLGYPLLRHIIAVAKRERITSVADSLASRYGKSTAVGVMATLIAVIGTVPYIALQLKAIANSFETMVALDQPSLLGPAGIPVDTSFFVAFVLAVFAILFGTRHADATEHQNGMMLAVAGESLVKLFAFVLAGLTALFVLFDGPSDLVGKAMQSSYVQSNFFLGINPGTFLVFTLLSAFAFVLLPRQFHVGVVENQHPRELETARWMFPLYLFLINLFVLPVALAGMLTFGQSVDADNYVLALPMSKDLSVVSVIVFLGGLSAATAMVIVASVALSIMISNNLVLPLILGGERGLARRFSATSGIDEGDMVRRANPSRDMAPVLLNIRRTAIFGVLTLAYIYFQIAGDSAALAQFGLLSFAAIAQFAPAFFIGFFWRAGTVRGALAGMSIGFFAWSYTLFLPTLLGPDSAFTVAGPLGLTFLKPHGLLYTNFDPLSHGVFVSLLLNTLAYVVVSKVWPLNAPEKGIDQMQANAFWFFGDQETGTLGQPDKEITVADLRHVVANYLGHARSKRAFDAYFHEHGLKNDTRATAGSDLIRHTEQILASAIGGASARLVMSLLLERTTTVPETTIKLLDDASSALRYNHELLQTALDQVEQGISVFDHEFKLSSWNRQFRLLLELPHEMGRPGTRLSDVAAAISERASYTSSPSNNLVKLLLDTTSPTYLTVDRSNRIIEVQTRPVPDGGVVISWNDMTERATAARALQIANESLERRVKERTEELTKLNRDLARAHEAAESANIGKTRFLAAVGHDILQPLNAARLYTSSLVEQLEVPQTAGLAKHIDDSLESVEEILGSVLTISRLDAGALTPNVTEFSADRLLKKLDVEFTPTAISKGLKLDVKYSDFTIRSDYALLRRLLQNLVSNAIKYTSKGSVTLNATVEGNHMVFLVADTGHGIAEADGDAIFQEFHRLEAGKDAASGLGLGLSIVKRVADTLGHSIQFTSRPGVGSSFCVKVPLGVQKAQDDMTSDASNHSKPKPVAAARVLCIDNEPRILDGMRVLLEGWQCEVFTYSSSEGLAAALPKIKPDIILADYHLDHETGIDVIALVRANLGAELPAVLITADRSAAVREAAKAVDVTMLNKPLKPAALRALVRQAFRRTPSADTVAAE